MPDYNKGDFTQQGIDGFVEGGLHLNEKRCLTAKISTDEDSAGLDSVEINIHDHLNDLDYTFSGENVIAGTSVIGQAPSGNIEITENTAEGESLNIAQYATATVNVESGIPLENVQVTLLDNVSFTASEHLGGDIFDTFDLQNCRGIPLGSEQTVLVKLDSGENVEYPCSMDLSTGDFTIGDTSLTETPLAIMGNMSDGYCSIYTTDTNTHTITVKFSINGVPTVFECNGGDRIALRSDNYLFVMSCEELTPGRTTVKTYPVPISVVGNKPRLYSWSVNVWS